MTIQSDEAVAVAAAPLDLFMTVPEVAGLLRLSEAQLRDLTQAGRFPVRPVRAGRRLLFVRTEIMDYVEALLAARTGVA